DVGQRLVDGRPDDAFGLRGVKAGVLGERDEGGARRGELGPQERQVLPRTEAARRRVPEDALDRGRVAVGRGLLACGVLDATGQESVDDEVGVLAGDRHVFLRVLVVRDSVLEMPRLDVWPGAVPAVRARVL